MIFSIIYFYFCISNLLKVMKMNFIKNQMNYKARIVIVYGRILI